MLHHESLKRKLSKKMFLHKYFSKRIQISSDKNSMSILALATNLYQCIYGCNDEGDENGDGEEGRELRMAVLLYAMTWFCVVSQKT